MEPFDIDNLPAPPSAEELARMLEKAQKEYLAALEKMTPEEREQAEATRKRLAKEETARLRSLAEDAAKLAVRTPPKTTPKFCTNCGAPVSGGKFCTNCGSPL